MSSIKARAKQVIPKDRSLQLGSAMIEFAFIMILLLLIVAGVFGFGRAFWYADALTKSTRDGARLLSTWTIAVAADTTAGVTAAQNIAMSNANAANLSPQLAANNVVVECAYSAFTFVACSGATKPINIRVSITGFSVNLDEWFPFISTAGVINYGSVSLSPHTTMRYMN
jgi:Flp pilus assembly protein TadG